MTVAAYAFTTPSLLLADGSALDSIKGSDYFHVFRTGSDCRNALSYATSAVQVIVSEEVSDVAPLNLVAALHRDEPQRDIYMATVEVSAALSSRVRAAGGRGIIDYTQMETMVGFGQRAVAQQKSVVEDKTVLITKTPAVFKQEPLLQSISQVSLKDFSIPIMTTPQSSATASFPGAGGCVTAFVSGRGGVGKSTLSLLTAILLQKRSFKVVLVDLDLQFGDLAYCVGQVPESAIQRISLDTALNGPERPQPATNRLCLIEAPSRPEYAEEHADEISALIASLATRAEYVIINTGSFWSELQAILAKNADRLIFVMDQRATSVRGCKQAVDLCIRLQIPSVRFGFLLNRCTRNTPLTTLDVSLALGGVEVYGIADGGRLVDEMLSLGSPYELLESDAALRESFDPLLVSLKATGQPSQNRVAPALGAFASIIKGWKRGSGHVTS